MKIKHCNYAETYFDGTGAGVCATDMIELDQFFLRECLYELPGPNLPRKGAWGLRKHQAGDVPSNRAEAVQYEA
jgi:hypothetical protein